MRKGMLPPQDWRMVYRNSGSLGSVLWSCGLGKRDIRSLSFLCPSVFIFFFSPPSCSLTLWSGKARLSSHLWFSVSPLFVGGLCCWSQQNCREALCQAVFSVVVCCTDRGRDLRSDSNRKAFISSTCHDPGTASPGTISLWTQWKVWSLDRQADWFLAYGT